MADTHVYVDTMAEKVRHKRGVTFTKEEMEVMLDEVEHNKSVLFGSFRNAESHKAKAATWVRIAKKNGCF